MVNLILRSADVSPTELVGYDIALLIEPNLIDIISGPIWQPQVVYNGVNFTLQAYGSPNTDILGFIQELITADPNIIIYAYGSELIVEAPPGGFPTQILGLKAYYNGAVRDLCLVAIADAPIGDRLVINKNGVNYAVYLVDTTDLEATPIRIKTLDNGIKAIRRKT